MASRQQRYLERKISEGYRQVTFMLTASEIEELDRRAAKAGSRLRAAQDWLKTKSAIPEK